MGRMRRLASSCRTSKGHHTPILTWLDKIATGFLYRDVYFIIELYRFSFVQTCMKEQFVRVLLIELYTLCFYVKGRGNLALSMVLASRIF